MKDFARNTSTVVSTRISKKNAERLRELIPAIHRDIFEFGFETGVRPGELAAIKVKDFDLKKGIVLIQRTYSACKPKETPKEEKKKPIPLSDRAYALTEKHLERNFPQDSFLFINPNTGRGYTTNNLGKIWRQYSGVRITLYEASRHSFCTQIVEGGATEFEAQILMRHSDPRSSRVYIHANVRKYRDLVNRRGRVVQLRQKKEGPG